MSTQAPNAADGSLGMFHDNLTDTATFDFRIPQTGVCGYAQYWLKVAAKHGFAIDQVSFLPDHVHLLVRAKPKQSVKDCALKLLNNSQHFVGARYQAALIEVGINNLWAPGAYVGTCGRVTTADVKSFLCGLD